jgi:hypothetical protein
LRDLPLYPLKGAEKIIYFSPEGNIRVYSRHLRTFSSGNRVVRVHMALASDFVALSSGFATRILAPHSSGYLRPVLLEQAPV